MRFKLAAFFCLVLLLAFIPTSSQGQIVINEVLADNQGSVVNGSSFPDYVELVNVSSSTVNLGGMSLSDNTNSPLKYVVPSNTLLNPGDFLLLWCDNNSGKFHTGFSFKSDGEEVALFRNTISGSVTNSTIVDRVVFGLQVPDFSLGRVPNGTGTFQLNVPSPALTNRAATLGSQLTLKFNEWMATNAVGTSDEDWLELYNPSTNPVALGGLIFTGKATSTGELPVPALSFIAGSGFIKFICDKSPEKGADHLDFRLSSTSGETLSLFLSGTTLIDRISFAGGTQLPNQSSGRLPDGSANIIQFAVGKATPGASNFQPLTNIVINEVLTHTDPPLEDAIELYNTTGVPVDISNWWLSNSTDDPKKFRIPDNTILGPFGYIVFYEYFGLPGGFNPSGTGTAPSFTLNSAHGDEVFLFSGDANGDLTGLRGSVSFGPAENGVSFGRYQKSSGGIDFVAMSRRTFGSDNPSSLPEFRLGHGATNAYPKVGPIVINEIHFHPRDILVGTNQTDNTEDEFIELFNIASTNAFLYDPAYPTNTWQLSKAVSYTFPATNVSLPPGGFLVVVNFDPTTNLTATAAFRTNFSIPANVRIFGPMQGKLSNGGDTLELFRPDPVQLPPHPDAGFVPYVRVDRVKYSDAFPWPTNTDGTGASLQRINASLYGNDFTNWTGAAPTAGRINAGSSLDRDSDGMLDSWEIANGLNPNDPTDASGDLDADGMTNLQEFLAGTDPRDALSRLKVVSAVRSKTSIIIRFEGVAGKSYSVQYANSLPADIQVPPGTWTKVGDITAQSTGVQQITDATAGTSSTRFYRVVTPAQ